VGFTIRRTAVDLDVPLVTESWLARRIITAMSRYGGPGGRKLTSHPWHRYLATRRRGGS
jgi:hypothetical protein